MRWFRNSLLFADLSNHTSSAGVSDKSLLIKTTRFMTLLSVKQPPVCDAFSTELRNPPFSVIVGLFGELTSTLLCLQLSGYCCIVISASGTMLYVHIQITMEMIYLKLNLYFCMYAMGSSQLLLIGTVRNFTLYKRSDIL